MKYDPFLIFWCIFYRNLSKIEYENEVCFEACRFPNFFLTVLQFFEKIVNGFQFLHNFPLVYILSFQKSNTCLQKILDIKKLFKKLWWKFLLIFSKFRLRSSILQRNFANFENAILHQNRPTNGWDIIKRRLENRRKSNKINLKENSIWRRNGRFLIFFWWYLSHLLMDFDAK
jgi:hypothetical protein